MSKPLTTHHSPLTPIIAFVLGTRPEAIKLAPVILRMLRTSGRLSPMIISTGQQADLVGPALADFGLQPDVDLRVMRPGQSLARLTARCLARISVTLRDSPPKMVVVQGDTTSALAGAQAAFFEKIPIAHVEAGLRTGDLSAPFPEEANRQMISRIAQVHFAPTVDAKANLLADGIEAERIEVTGNTVVDALKLLAPQLRRTPSPVSIPPHQKLVLVTAHRRENHGLPLASICSAVRQLAESNPELKFVFITHPNPAAARVAAESLMECPRVTLLPPQPYITTLRLVAESWLVLTDSGGLQEEAPSFRRPVLVLRDRTERTEGVDSQAARLVGTDARKITQEVTSLLRHPTAYARVVPASNPYGDGKAAARIVQIIAQTFATKQRERAA